MDELFTVLSTSSDNAARKAAASQLRQLQEQQPEAFVRYTWERVACVTLPPALRFFVCSTVVSFVDESWHSAVSREVQASVLQLYVEQLALRERFTSVALARKVATAIARMAKRSTARSTALPRGLPPLVEYVVRAYVQALQVQCASLETAAAAASSNSADASSSTSAAAAALDMLPQVLLLLHVLLKELQSKRVGMSFAQLCAIVAPTLSALLVRMTATLDVTPRHGEAYVYAMKCALRVYGHGILDVAFCRFALTLTWQLATHITTAAEQQQQQQQPLVDDGSTAEATALLMRLLEYAMKIHVSVVASFASKFTLTDDSHTMTTTQTTAAQEQRLPLSFFVDDADGDDGGGGRALLRLLTAIVVANSAFSLRVTCRALRLLTLLCSLEQSSAYAAEVLRRYTRASPPMLPSLLSHLITDYFADDVSAAAQRAWATSPEDVFDAADATATGGGGGASVVVVAGGGGNGGDDHERDVDVGDEDEHSLMDNAEQLFLALTSSPAASADALREAWAAVHTLLASGHAQDVTSALHVLGLGYRTMRSSNNNDNDGSSHAAGAASDADDADYVQFLTTRLLPVLHASASPDARVRPDVVVQRRVLWLIGMWCEATQRPQTRRVIHTAVEALLRLYTDYLAAATATSTTTSVIDGTVVVLALTALRTVQHFVADGAFTRAELTPTFVPTVMAAVQHVLPLLRAPSAVAAVAGVVHVLLAKLDALAVTDNNNNNTQQQRDDEDDDNDTAAAMMTMAGDGVYALRGDDVVRVFHPAVVRFVQRYTQKGEDDKNSKGNKDDSDEDEDKVNVGTLTLLLECLTSAARADASDVALWSLFDTVVVPCTQPGGALAPWVQDEAWELLLAMAQSTRARHASVQDALSYALHNTQRDFAALHTVLRVTYTLMLLQLLVVLPSPSQPALVGDGVDSGGGGGNVGDVATGSATFVSAGVLLRGSAEDYCTTEQVLQWLTTLVTTTSYELVQALQALLMTVARTSTGPLCELVITQCMSHLVVCGDVQAATYALPLCIVLNVALLASAAATAMTTMTTTTAAAAVSREKSAAVCFASPLLAHDTAARTEAALSLFVEQLVLLLDVSCDALTTQCVARLLRYTQETLPVSASDAAMMQSAAMAAMQLYAGGDDGSGQTTRTSTNNNVSGTTISAGADDDDGATVEQAVAEVRPFAELLVELLEDSASLSPPLPHLTRVLHAFALLEQAL